MLILHHSCGALDWGVNTFFFEAFDEPWKPHSTGDNGQASDETHWGAMHADRSQKFSLKCSAFQERRQKTDLNHTSLKD